MKVSIITCTYNSEEFLSDCVDSVSSQTYKNVEHIIIDAFSKDNTLDILKDYPDIKIYSRRPQGISDAMNYGIQVSNGDLIAHLHSDDYYYDSNVIKNVVNSLLKSDKKWCYGRHIALKPNNVKRTPELNNYCYWKIFWRNYIHHPTVFIRRELFEQLGVFNTDCKYAMDIDLWLRFLKKYEPLPINSIITYFRRLESSLSIKEKNKAMHEALKIYFHHSRGNPILFFLSLSYYFKKRIYNFIYK